MESELDMFLRSGDLGSFDNGDPTTTNLYLGNLNPKVEKSLTKCLHIKMCVVFIDYGTAIDGNIWALWSTR